MRKKVAGKGIKSILVGLKGKNKYLFKPGLRLRTYHTIGQWWTYPDGITPRTKGSIEAEMKAFSIDRHFEQLERSKEEHMKAKKKEAFAKSEKFIAVKHQWGGWEHPTDPDKLKAVLDKESDRTLYDWFSVMLGQPTIFQTIPPNWLLDSIQGQYQKCYDFVNALYQRLRCSNDPDVALCLEIYHSHLANAENIERCPQPRRSMSREAPPVEQPQTPLTEQPNANKASPPVEQPKPPIIEQPNESKESPPVEQPKQPAKYPPHSTQRYIPTRFIRDF